MIKFIKEKKINMVSLERNPAYTSHNIPLNEDHYYRGLNVDSYDDLWKEDEDGRKIMQGYGKGGTDTLSFQKSFPNDLYVNGIVKSNTIIEGTDLMPIVRHEGESGYTYVTELEQNKVESGETPLRIYQRRVLGGGAIEAVHVWDKVFDSFPESITQSPT